MIMAILFLNPAIECGHLFDFFGLISQSAPVEDHHAGGWAAGTVTQNLADLFNRHRLAPVGELHNWPDPVPFVRVSLDAKVVSQPSSLPRDPCRIIVVPKSGVVRHDAEDIDIFALGFQIDG